MFIICFYEDILMIFDSIILKLKGIMYLVYCAIFQNLFVYFYCCTKLQSLQSEVDKPLYVVQYQKEDRCIFNKNY